MDDSESLGVLGFAIGGLSILISFGVILSMIIDEQIDLLTLVYMLAFALLGFLLVGYGFSSIIRNSKAETKPAI